MKVVLLYFDGCPNWEWTWRQLEALSGEFGFALERCEVDTPEAAERLAFRGSPTVLIDGRDPFATGDEPVGLACRVYGTDAGLAGAPNEQQLRDELTGAS